MAAARRKKIQLRQMFQRCKGLGQEESNTASSVSRLATGDPNAQQIREVEMKLVRISEVGMKLVKSRR